jgi:hypothetical protein
MQVLFVPNIPNPFDPTKKPGRFIRGCVVDNYHFKTIDAFSRKSLQALEGEVSAIKHRYDYTHPWILTTWELP